MENWESILQGDELEVAQTVVDKIFYKVRTNFDAETMISVVEGTAGQLLFLSEYLDDAETIQPFIEKIFANIEQQKNLNGSLGYGLSGIGYILHLVNLKHDVLEPSICEDFYEYTRKFIQNDVDTHNFDFVGGYLGEVCFLLKECRPEKNKEIFASIVENLRSNATRHAKGVGWITNTEVAQYLAKNKNASGKKDSNLGMAHGSAGIISVLTQLAEQYQDPELSRLISDAIICLQNEESEENREKNGFFYRCYTGEMGRSYAGHLSWCYSDLSTALLYLTLWERTGNKEHFERANKIGHSCAEKKLEDIFHKAMGLCHGVAGIGHLFNKLYQKTGIVLYKDTARYWYKVLLEKSFINNDTTGFIEAFDLNGSTGATKPLTNGFLEGLSGVGLSILSAVSSKTPKWDEILLL